MIVAFDDYLDAVRCGRVIAMADGIVKKLVSAVAWPLPASFSAIRAHCPQGQSLLLGMVAEASLETFQNLLQPHGGTLTHAAPSDDSPGTVPLYEHTWNHTTLQMLKTATGVDLQSMLKTVVDTSSSSGEVVTGSAEKSSEA